jgi:hypothetical protein
MSYTNHVAQLSPVGEKALHRAGEIVPVIFRAENDLELIPFTDALGKVQGSPACQSDKTGDTREPSHWFRWKGNTFDIYPRRT